MTNYYNLLHSIRATTNSRERWIDPCTCETLITPREIWSKATRAAARKATAEGVNGLAIDEKGGKFFIYQISGYTPERGLFCDCLNELGQVVENI